MLSIKYLILKEKYVLAVLGGVGWVEAVAITSL